LTARDDDPDSTARMPPHDLEAEQAVLGAMMLSPAAIADVTGIIRPGDLYRPAHQLVCEAVLDLFARGEPADAVTVADLLGTRGLLGRTGGAPYLHTLIASVPVVASAAYYAEIVADKAARRRLTEAGLQIAQLGWAGDAPAAELISRAQALALQLGAERERGTFVPLADLVLPALEELEAAASPDGALMGVPTGLADLDALTHGLQPGQLIVVGARPSIGKTVLVSDWARHAAIRMGLPTVVFSLEMNRTEITMRLLSAEARVAMHSMRGGTLTDDDWTRLAYRMSYFMDAPLWVDDSPVVTIADIRARCRRLVHQAGLRLVVIDYLQLLTAMRWSSSRQQDVSEISRSLKLLAKELEVPVVAVSQLNRGPEQRHDRRPQLSDLRDSGSVEQDSDVVVLLHREDAYERESPRAGEADLIVAKHRNGPTATITVAFQGHYSRFVDMAPA
jgi:replicative DNA helicase